MGKPPCDNVNQDNLELIRNKWQPKMSTEARRIELLRLCRIAEVMFAYGNQLDKKWVEVFCRGPSPLVNVDPDPAMEEMMALTVKRDKNFQCTGRGDARRFIDFLPHMSSHVPIQELNKRQNDVNIIIKFEELYHKEVEERIRSVTGVLPEVFQNLKDKLVEDRKAAAALV